MLNKEIYFGKLKLLSMFNLFFVKQLDIAFLFNAQAYYTNTHKNNNILQIFSMNAEFWIGAEEDETNLEKLKGAEH